MLALNYQLSSWLMTHVNLYYYIPDHIDSTRSHDAAMQLLADAGIYVLVVSHPRKPLCPYLPKYTPKMRSAVHA